MAMDDDDDMLYREMDPDDDFYMGRRKKSTPKTDVPSNKDSMTGCLVIFALGVIGALLYMWLFGN